MKRVICDTCGTQTEPDAYGMAPHGSGWLTINWRKDFKSGDFCSDPCATKALEARALPVTSAQSQEFIDTGTFTPDPPVDADVARMHDEGNPNEVAF